MGNLDVIHVGELPQIIWIDVRGRKIHLQAGNNEVLWDYKAKVML